MSQDFDQYADEIADGLGIPADAPPTLSTISAVELQCLELPPQRWIVDHILTAGTYLFTASPKIGKSWAAMDLCISTATGGSFLGYSCYQTEALYMTLEDGARRLQDRLDRLLCGKPAPNGCRFATAAPMLNDGLIDAMEAYLIEYPNTGLIVIDTLQRVRDADNGKNVYGRDYADIVKLKKISDEHNICILLIHHLRKSKDSEDIFNMISGSNGLSGAADGMWVLEKAVRTDDTATLHITGRDVMAEDLIVKFNKDSCRWQSMGGVDEIKAQKAYEEYAASPIVQTVQFLLGKYGKWSGSASQLLAEGINATGSDIADSPRNLSNQLVELSHMMLIYNCIRYTKKTNGSGGARHEFSFVSLDEAEAATKG